jgi:hypothetical protein
MPAMHTIDSRNHLMLESLRKHYWWSDESTFNEIQVFRTSLIQILNSKRISYDELRTALTPQQTKQEAAFIFDCKRYDSSMYGKEHVSIV